MIKVTLKGLAARPLRTLLSALAIIVGVAFVCAALTLTDAMRGAANSLSSAAYDGTDAVVTAKTAFQPGMDSFAQVPTVPASTLDRVRSAPGVDVAVGDITDTAQIIGRDGKPLGDGPYFGSGFDARTPGAEELSPFRLDDGRWATGPGEVVIDQGTAEKQDLALGGTVEVATRGEAKKFDVVGIATFADVKSIGTATFAIFDLDHAKTLFAKDGYDRILVSGDRSGLAAAAGDGTQVSSAAADDRYDLEGLSTFVDILRTILLAFAGVAMVVGAFTIFNALSIAVAQRTRELGLLRMVGASRRQVRRTVMLEALAIGLGASALGIGAGLALAFGLDSVFTSMGLGLPMASLSLSGGTVVAAAAGRHPGDTRGGAAAGPPRHQGGARGRAARRSRRRCAPAAPGPRGACPDRADRAAVRRDRRLGRQPGPPQRDAPSRSHGGDGVRAADRRGARHCGHGRRPGPQGRLRRLARAARPGHHRRRLR